MECSFTPGRSADTRGQVVDAKKSMPLFRWTHVLFGIEDIRMYDGYIQHEKNVAAEMTGVS